MSENSVIRAGSVGEMRVTVTPELTASAYRNEGVEVLATPMVVWLVEGASVRALEGALGPGEATVGTHVDLRHLRPTPVGMTAIATSRVTGVEGGRILFKAEVRDERERIAMATHERHVVNLDRFLRKANGKKPARSGE